MSAAKESMARNADTGVTGGIASPLATILAQFGPPAETEVVLHTSDSLDPAERQSLMNETAERLHQQYHGQSIDCPVVDGINAKIGRTFTRPELVKLLAEYAAAILW